MGFPEAEKKLFHVKICRRCNARNAWRATICRKCGKTGVGSLRPKRKEIKG